MKIRQRHIVNAFGEAAGLGWYRKSMLKQRLGLAYRTTGQVIDSSTTR
ncbi:hypothetical protein [Sphingobium sp. CFD-2]|nr:hypothetical protein [Sphingobium sp. CFD-2]